MKQFFYLLFALLLTFSALAQNTINDWENPKMIGQNKEKAHTTLMPFKSVKAALVYKRKSERLL